jgi:hypothetical protein
VLAEEMIRIMFTSSIRVVIVPRVTTTWDKRSLFIARPFHSTKPSSDSLLSWPRVIWKRMWNIYRGDDRINPKKILERKYLYLTLLAIKFRNLRLLEQIENGTTLDALYEKAIEELDAMHLDKTTNVDLRLLQQSMLEPQVREIFENFQKVDNRLGIPLSVERSDNTSSVMDEGDFEATYKDVLVNEFDRTQQQLSEVLPESTSQNEFLTTKKEAIFALLQYHGWDRGTDSTSSSGSPITNTSLDPFGMTLNETKDNTMRLIRQYQTVNLCRSALIREELGYSVLSLRSSIPGGGRGLFVDGSAMAGAIVAFQPGDIWPKEHIITDAPDVMEHFAGEDDCQISLRFDDYVVDSRQSPVVVICRDGSLNPWALGNMVNHPNPPIVPNCQSTMLNFTAKAKLENLIQYVPNSYAKLPTWQSSFFDIEEVIMHGLCLVARKDVHNEELFYDYRLQSEKTPDWYTIVKYENGLDEEQVVFFRDDWRKDK